MIKRNTMYEKIRRTYHTDTEAKRMIVLFVLLAEHLKRCERDNAIGM